MKKFKLGFYALTALTAFSIICQSPAIADTSSSARAAYDKYTSSYNEFKKAVENNLDEETIKKYSEIYKADLENYKKLTQSNNEYESGKSAEISLAEGASAKNAAFIAAAETPLEKAILQIHTGENSKLDEAISTLIKISENSKNKSEIERAKYELAGAYVIKKEYAKAEELLKSAAADASNPMNRDAEKSLETLNYLKKRADLSNIALKARTDAINKKEAYEGISWKNPFKKLAAGISKVKSALSYRKSMTGLKSFDGDGKKGFIEVTKTFITDVFKKRLTVDDCNTTENKLISGEIIWKKRQRLAALLENSDGVYKICNVRWGFYGSGDEDQTIPKWRSVTIDTKAVKEAYLVIKPFAPEWIAGHCFFMFEFDESHPVVTEYGEKTYGFIVSMEARQKQGESYSFTGSFGVAYLLLSKEDYIQICSINGSRLIPYKLKLSGEQKKGLIVKAIEESLEERGMERYELFENNCTNILFGMLNAVLPEDQRFKEWIIKGILYNKLLAIPKAAPKFLKKHDLIAEIMPTIYPDKNNAIDKTGKLLEGAELVSASKSLSELTDLAGNVKSAMLKAIDNQSLNREKIKKLFYDQESSMIFSLNIPGVFPEESEKSAFSIDETAFITELNAAASSEELKTYIESLFSNYIKALEERMKIYPDVSKYMSNDLKSLEKRIND